MRRPLFWIALAASCAIDGAAVAAEDSCSYWLETSEHQGIAAFNADPSEFQVFRNVKEFGAKGDGETDDTDAINEAISSGNTCAPGECLSSTTTQALVYFPSGTYMVNSTIIQNYGVSLHGNPNCMPTVKAFSSFANGPGEVGLIDGNPNNPSNGDPYTDSNNIFFRQLRNLVIDTTSVPAESEISGIHWPSAQATSVHNVVFNMPTSEGVEHTGLVSDAGGMIFFNDLVFNGGLNGFTLDLSQVVMRNVTFNDCVNGINLASIWSLSSSQLRFVDCETGIQNSEGDGIISVVDSSIKNTEVGIVSNFGGEDAAPASNSIILENLQLEDVPTVVQNSGDATDLTGPEGTSKISAWGQGNSYVGSTSDNFSGEITPIKRPDGLLAPDSGNWYARSKPGYNTLPESKFVSARSAGAKGDGTNDDTEALQAAIHDVADQSKVLFLDQGSYKVTQTLYVPADTKIVGEAFPNIFASGDYFAELDSLQPLLRVGEEGESGSIELSDFILGTQGSTPGAVLIEHNLASTSDAVGGYWDIHSRIGGWAGSHLSIDDCPPTPDESKPPVNEDCMAAAMGVHITKSASGVYMENCWTWTADHDIDEEEVAQIEVYSGRGILVESEEGNNWFISAPTEHHSKYQYNMVNTKNVYMHQLQTETPYYQPNPDATSPYPNNDDLHDPEFDSSDSQDKEDTTAMAWGQHISNSEDISIYGTALFAWYRNWSHDCGSNNTCQQNAFSIDEDSTDINIYAFTTGKMQNLIVRDGDAVVPYDPDEGKVNSIAMFRQ